MNYDIVCKSPAETFNLGVRISALLHASDVILLYGGLGAGKTLLTKGILAGLDFDVDEVTSPSFTLVNLYRTEQFDVYHIDLWRLDASQNAGEAVGLEEILDGERSVTIIEWADRLGEPTFPNRTLTIEIEGDGDQERKLRTMVRVLKSPT